MQKTFPIACIIFAALAFPAAAQEQKVILSDCENLSPDVRNDYDTAFACIELLRDEISGLRNSLGPLLMAAGQTGWLQDHVDAKTEPGVPAGLVVASLQSCDNLPGGWSDFHEARGRMIVGAGDHAKNPFSDGLSVRSAFVDGMVNPKNQTVGGAETVTLTEMEMPSHAHEVTDPEHAHPDRYVSTREGDNLVGYSGIRGAHSARWDTYGSSTGITIKSAGSDQPHNNMPPYIALYFCKKD